VTLDEFGKMSNGQAQYNDSGSVTDTRIIITTPNDPGSTLERLWKAKDTTENRANFPTLFKVAPIKQEIPWHAVEEFTKDSYYDEHGQLRSPWFNWKAQKLAQEEGGDETTVAARELCCKFVRSTDAFFADDLVTKLLATSRPAEMRRAYDPVRHQFAESPDGMLFQWNIPDPSDHTDAEKKLQLKRYAMGIDVSAGAGSSNSVAEIFDVETGEQVAEYATAWTEPTQMADLCVDLAKWYNNAFMLWETGGGTGFAFGKRVRELGYANIYYRRREESNKRAKDKALLPGWVNDEKNASLEFWGFKRDLGVGKYKVFSAPALEELRAYQYTEKGSAKHGEASTTETVTAARANHGDRAMALVMARKAAQENPVRVQVVEKKIPVASFAYRQKMRRHRENEGQYHI
jgi:hypothetical protein